MSQRRSRPPSGRLNSMVLVNVVLRLLLCYLLGIAALLVPPYPRASAAEGSPALLTPEALIEGWESTYGSIQSMEISTTARLVRTTKPTTSENDPHWVEINHVEKVILGSHYYTRISNAAGGFADPKTVAAESFDGNNSMEYEPAKRRGVIYRGGSGKFPATVNDVAQCLLMELLPPVGNIPKSRWGKSVFSDDFRDFSKNGQIRPDAKVRLGLETVHGELCHVLECGDDNAEHLSITRVWLAHEKGMLPMKYEKIMSGEVCKTIEVTQLGKATTDVGIIWFPAKATVQSGMSWTGRAEREIVTHKFVPHAVVSEETFKMTFPPGTRVYDKNLEIVYTTGSPELGKSTDVFDVRQAISDKNDHTAHAIGGSVSTELGQDKQPAPSALSQPRSMDSAAVSSPHSANWSLTMLMVIVSAGLVVAVVIVLTARYLRRRRDAQ